MSLRLQGQWGHLTFLFQQDLKQCQSRSAKKRIKQQALRQLAFASDSALPEEVGSIRSETLHSRHFLTFTRCLVP